MERAGSAIADNDVTRADQAVAEIINAWRRVADIERLRQDLRIVAMIDGSIDTEILPDLENGSERQQN